YCHRRKWPVFRYFRGLGFQSGTTKVTKSAFTRQGPLVRSQYRPPEIKELRPRPDRRGIRRAHSADALQNCPRISNDARNTRLRRLIIPPAPGIHARGARARAGRSRKAPRLRKSSVSSCDTSSILTKTMAKGRQRGAPGSLKTSPSLPQGTLYIVQGQLFSTFFLDEGICETPHWKDLEEADLDAFLSRLQSIYASVDAESQLDEATTETELIVKVLAALGWSELLPQHSASGSRREDIPDILLLADAAAKREALSDRREDGRFVHGLAIVECKRWLRPLDRGDSTDRLDPGTPSNQILRYLSAAETASERRIQWGFLTNGAQWRIYYQGARTRSEEFLEIDLPPLLGTRGFKADLPFGGTP